MMSDYMEALVSQLGLQQVLADLRNVVIDMANETGDHRLWLLEQDLSINIQEFEHNDYKD